jgi:hypothetical protein
VAQLEGPRVGGKETDLSVEGEDSLAGEVGAGRGDEAHPGLPKGKRQCPTGGRGVEVDPVEVGEVTPHELQLELVEADGVVAGDRLAKRSGHGHTANPTRRDQVRRAG